MRAILTLARKDIRLLTRDKFALFWIFAFPLAYACFFGAIFGGSGGSSHRIEILVIDEDRSEESSRLIDRLAEHRSIRLDRNGTDDSATPKLHTVEGAQRLVRKGDRTAYLRIPTGYGDASLSMFGVGPTQRPKLEVGIDPTRTAERGFLQGVLMETVFGVLGETFTDRTRLRAEVDRIAAGITSETGLAAGQRIVLQQLMRALGSFVDDVDPTVLGGGPGGGFGPGDQIEFVEVTKDQKIAPRTPFDITFPSAIVWGLMGVAAGFGITLVREREHGTLLRLRIAPISRAQLLAGKALACFTMCLIVMAFLMVFATVFLGVRIDNVPLALLSAVCTALCFTGLMMTIAVMGKTEQAVAGASWGVMMPFAMVGGGMIPLIAMPPWLLTISNVSPFKWGIYSLEGAVWREFELADMVLPCGILIGIGALFFAIGVYVFRKID